MSIYPKDFLWGTATAAHQVEGNNVNSDFWLAEHVPHTIFAQPSGDAIDHYHRYREDIALLADLGFNSYRFSVEWARIEPEPGVYSMAAINHYRRMLETCHEHGLEPMVTYHHFTSPRWLISQGGWLSPETPARFADYCGAVTRHLGDLMVGVCTINEINIPSMIGLWMQAAGERSSEGAIGALGDPMQFMQEVTQAFGIAPNRLGIFMFVASQEGTEVLLEAHRQAVQAIRSERGDLPVGVTIAMQDMQAAEGGETMRDQMRAKLQNIYLEVARDDDFVGVQTYSRDRVGPDGLLPPEEGVELTQMGYEFWPQALEETIRYASQKTGLPIMVTENGIGTEDDTRRVVYYRRALQGVETCLKEGIDVRGYYAWSAFDNFEWMLGYGPKFGLIAVDRATQERTVKPSAYWLRDYIKAQA